MLSTWSTPLSGKLEKLELQQKAATINQNMPYIQHQTLEIAYYFDSASGITSKSS